MVLFWLLFLLLFVLLFLFISAACFWIQDLFLLHLDVISELKTAQGGEATCIVMSLCTFKICFY